MSVAFLALHIVTAILDPFTSLGTAAVGHSAGLRLPAASRRPSGWISVDLALAIIVTSLLRDRIGHRTWRLVHWAAYGAWPLAILHTLYAGSDSLAPWMLAVTVASVVAVGAVPALAVDDRDEPEPARRRDRRHRRSRRGPVRMGSGPWSNE